MTQQEYIELAKKIAEGSFSDEELALYNASFNAFQETEESTGLLNMDALESESMENIREVTLQDIRITPQDAPVRRIWLRITAVASITILLSAGTYFLLRPPTVDNPGQQYVNDVLPGKNQAILTLANGKKISISDDASGQLAKQGNVNIVKTNGELSYQQSGPSNDQAILYNTISTPVSGQHEVTLSDGTKVILDANSSITFPVTFIARERKVSMTGQAYFTVRHNASKPFRVSVKGQMVEDLGTEFNINAYDDEPGLKTTLVSGSASFNRKVLKPGEQAVFTGDRLITQTADLDAVTAWKDGNFSFHSENLDVAMRQLGRWYNIKVVYENAPKDLLIGGDISRKRNLSVVLHAIERTGRVKFRIENQTVYVSQ